MNRQGRYVPFSLMVDRRRLIRQRIAKYKQAQWKENWRRGTNIYHTRRALRHQWNDIENLAPDYAPQLRRNFGREYSVTNRGVRWIIKRRRYQSRTYALGLRNLSRQRNIMYALPSDLSRQVIEYL